MKASRFFWSAYPAQALFEAWLIGLLILFLLSLQVGTVAPSVLSNGLLFLCGTCGMWVVLRTHVPQGNWLRQGAWELAVGIGLSLVMAVGMRLPAHLMGWEGVWLQSSWGGVLTATLVLLATGPGYLAARVGVRAWHRWDHLRRRRLIWAFTHAHLTVVLLVIVFGAISLLLLWTFSRTETFVQPPGGSLLTSITERLLHTVFPGMSMVVIMTAIVLLVLLPPSALVSFLVARRTTRRLQALVDAAQAFRQGNYNTRVEVVGQDEVAQLQADFNAMADDLARTLDDLHAQRDRVANLLESRRELVASVSHELRTPVTTVRATLESALGRQSETLPDSLRHDLEVMDGEILRLQGLIDDLFTLARADAGGLALECEPVDLSPVVQRMVDALAPLAWKTGRVELTAELPIPLPPVRADQARLEQILSNLLRNGIRHTPPGGIVAVMAAVEGDAIRIEVRDTGEGIAPDDLPYIWQRFYRGRSEQAPRQAGAGLGLALVKELTEAMAGSVEVESAVGEGSCFTIRLPRA